MKTMVLYVLYVTELLVSMINMVYIELFQKKSCLNVEDIDFFHVVPLRLPVHFTMTLQKSRFYSNFAILFIFHLFIFTEQ